MSSLSITDKAIFRRLWLAGELGNRPRVWTSLEALHASKYDGTLSLRIHVPSSPFSMYNVPMKELCRAMWHLAERGVDNSQVWFNESAPDDCLKLQGEYFHGVKNGAFLNRYLNFSRAQSKMKDAMLLPRFVPSLHGDVLQDSEGLRTDEILRAVMTPYSWEEFQELRERFPDHTIEFGVYDCAVGIQPHCNHLIWEIRDY